MGHRVQHLLPMVSNGILERQNEEHCLRALAAQRLLYSRAKLLTGARAAFTALLPVATWLGAIWWPQLRPWGVGLVLAWLFLDLTLFTRAENQWRLLAARMQEWFDTRVLEIEWSTHLAGLRPTAEDFAGVMPGGPSPKQRRALVDWYPVAVGSLPMGWARLACQRVNAWWDGSQHLAYARASTFFVVVWAAVPTIVGTWSNVPVHDYLMTFLGPVVPLLAWGLRERDQHTRAATKLDDLRRSAVATWHRCIEDGVEPDARATRALQDQIFDSRRTCPPVFDWVYRLQRAKKEAGALDLACETVDAVKERLKVSGRGAQ